MYISTTNVRVRYAETDQMDVVYHGNYAQYFEVGRVEAIRQLGLSYKEIEAMGVIMPIVEWQAKYLRPAHYDELLTIRTILHELPLNHRIEFEQEVYNEKGELLTKGKVLLYFLSIENKSRIPMPEALKLKLEIFFRNNSTNLIPCDGPNANV